MWLNFDASYPMAVKVAAGKINALTGGQWKNELSKRPQDYLVVPDQPWLDGFCVDRGVVRQFVAMPLGEGYTAEEQLTGEAQHGGIQIVVHPMKAARFKALQRARPRMDDVVYNMAPPPAEMGLAPGGLMRQELYEDEYGFDAWDTSARSRCFVHILNSVQFLQVAGAEPPQPSPHSGGVHCRRAAVVRLLRRRPDGAGRVESVVGLGQRRRHEPEEGRGHPRGQRPRAADARP